MHEPRPIKRAIRVETNAPGVLIDSEGVEMADPHEARVQAVIACGEAIKELDGAFWKQGEWQMRVVDESGAPVCALTLSGSW